MKNARRNISDFRFIVFELKFSGEIVNLKNKSIAVVVHRHTSILDYYCKNLNAVYTVYYSNQY